MDEIISKSELNIEDLKKQVTDLTKEVDKLKADNDILHTELDAQKKLNNANAKLAKQSMNNSKFAMKYSEKSVRMVAEDADYMINSLKSSKRISIASGICLILSIGTFILCAVNAIAIL